MRPKLPQILVVRHRANGVDIDVLVNPDLVWFDGHFPGRPILPGVVQIDWALAMARTYLGLAVTSGRRFQVKFKAIICPRDQLVLSLDHDPIKNRLIFCFRRKQDVCSNGHFSLEPA